MPEGHNSFEVPRPRMSQHDVPAPPQPAPLEQGRKKPSGMLKKGGVL